MTSAVSNQTILRQLTEGDAEPVLVAEFRAWTTAPRLSRLLGGQAGGHPIYQVDPVGVLSGDRRYLPVRDLAAAAVGEFLASGPAGGHVFIVGHCSASALSLHVARLLEASRDVTAILLGPVWPDEEHVRSRFAEALSNFRVPDRPCPALDGDPDTAVARMEQVLKEELDALAASRGVNGAAKAFGELLAWHRGWLAFLLACHNDPPIAWENAATEVIALSRSTADVNVPGLSQDAYQRYQAPVLSEEDPITPELAACVLAQLRRSPSITAKETIQ
ncbi:MAG TPA: hypothetical protein VKU39_04520 [Streptosporangiaceae bacterium]|nr:hypothetical protein [Streptosporangiaceae bacterium]